MQIQSVTSLCTHSSIIFSLGIYLNTLACVAGVLRGKRKGDCEHAREGRRPSFLLVSLLPNPKRLEFFFFKPATQARITFKWVDLRDILHLPSRAPSSPFHLFRLTTTAKKLEEKNGNCRYDVCENKLLCIVQSWPFYNFRERFVICSKIETFNTILRFAVCGFRWNPRC